MKETEQIKRVILNDQFARNFSNIAEYRLALIREVDKILREDKHGHTDLLLG